MHVEINELFAFAVRVGGTLVNNQTTMSIFKSISGDELPFRNVTIETLSEL